MATEAGGQAVALAVGYGYNLAVRVAARRPDVLAATNPDFDDDALKDRLDRGRPE